MPGSGSFMYLLYNAVIAPLRGVARVRAACASSAESRAEWRERTAQRLPDPVERGWWLHGSSVGEARLLDAVAARARAVDPELLVAGSAVTPTGREALARSQSLARSFFAPLDLPGWPGRVLDALRPAGLGLVETELWPNWMRETRRRGIPVAVINGRLSPKRMGTYRRFGALYRAMLAEIDALGAQSDEDAARFASLGMSEQRIEVTGNLKYDLPAPKVERAALYRRFGLAPERTVAVAGSTGAGEEPAVLDAFEMLRRAAPDALLVLAPRHPRRAPEVQAEIVRRGLRCHPLSVGRDSLAAAADVLLVDTLGELGALYLLAPVAFVGGSLVPIGGHNVLEPVAAGAGVLVGPHTEHAAEPTDTLLAAGAARRVHDGRELGEQWSCVLTDVEEARRLQSAGRAVLAAHRGALDRTVALLARTFGTRP